MQISPALEQRVQAARRRRWRRVACRALALVAFVLACIVVQQVRP